MVHYALLRTAVDPLLAVTGPQGLVRLEFLPRAWEYHTRAHAVVRDILPDETDLREDTACFADLTDQLADYFVGRRTTFDLAVDLHGSEFQLKVWRHLQRIPYGKLRTYGEIAVDMQQPKAGRAVGQATGHNPLPIIVPCHRLVSQGGSLVGFAGDITTQARLLRLEGHTLGDRARIEEPRLF
jgi:methylated-DNA-[protein]-cysteine S-methyltransferase